MLHIVSNTRLSGGIIAACDKTNLAPQIQLVLIHINICRSRCVKSMPTH